MIDYISLVKWSFGDIVNKTHVVLIIGQNKMCAKFRALLKYREKTSL